MEDLHARVESGTSTWVDRTYVRLGLEAWAYEDVAVLIDVG